MPCHRTPIPIGAPSGKHNRRLWYHAPFRSTRRRVSRQQQIPLRHSGMGNGQEPKKAGLAGTPGDRRWNSAFRSGKVRDPHSQTERPHSSFITHHSHLEVDLEPAACKQSTEGLPDGRPGLDLLHAVPALLRVSGDSPAPLRLRSGSRRSTQHALPRGGRPGLDSSLGRRDHLRMGGIGRG